jgi:DNA invertase Pin-like site-specific DNA recombinase
VSAFTCGVSTDGQTTENQRRELEAVAARSRWEVVDFYEDAGISASNGREKRPGMDRLLKDATARRINMIAAWSVDRLGRSLQHLVELLNELQALHWQSIPASAGNRYDYSVRQGHVPDVWRFCRV